MTNPSWPGLENPSETHLIEVLSSLFVTDVIVETSPAQKEIQNFTDEKSILAVLGEILLNLLDTLH